MLGFAKIAGGMPSSVSNMTGHLMTQTLSPEQVRLAAYYGRGMVHGPSVDPDEQRAVENAEHVEAWTNGEAAPDLARLAEYCLTPDAEMDYNDVEVALITEIEQALTRAELRESGLQPMSREQRAFHGLPEPPPAPGYLEGLTAADLRQRRDALDADWSTALTEAVYKADVAASRSAVGPDAPSAVIRPDMHVSVALGLGISPEQTLDTDQINALLAGRRADGARIEGKEYAEERKLPTDPKTGEARLSMPIGSYDFCPTPDKSISVAWAFAEPVEQAMIFNAHSEAAREAVGYIAGEIGQARLGHGGEDGSVPGHVGWLEFTHHTSRRVQIKEGDVIRDAGPGDPNLHTHFLIPNAVFVPASGAEPARVGSLDTAAIGGFIFEADAFYHARLSQKLRDAGFEARLDPETGAARMPVISDAMRELFSKRTNSGEALARRMAADEGLNWDELTPKQRATREKNATQSFEQKQRGGKDDVADVESWQRQAKETLGWEAPATMQLYGPPPPPLTHEQQIRQAYEVALPYLAEKLEQNSVIKHYDLRVAALRGLVQTGNPGGLSDVDAVTRIMAKEGVLQNGEKTELVWGQEPGKRYQSITTRMHQTDERAFIDLMKAAAADKSGAIPKPLLKEKIKASGLDFTDAHGKAQREAIVRLGRGGRFGLVVGAAGMGKTAAIGPLAAAWREQGREVWGTSLAWRQTDDLALKATKWSKGIDKRNTKAFSVLLDGLNNGSIKLNRNAVLVVDEYGMLGTRQGLELLRAQKQQGFSIVALGDDKQATSPMAGPIIDLSRRALGPRSVPEILTTKRQKTEREREIVGLLRQGRAAEALAMKREDGSAEMAAGGRAGVIDRVSKLYAERLAATGEAPGISAPTNRDAHDISAAVRLERRDMGLVGADILTVKATDGTRNYDLALAKGDRVRLFKSTGATYENGRGGPIGRNGSVLEVINADRGGLTLRNDQGKVGTVRWGKLAHNGRTHLAYGDATTIHTAQGSSRGEQISAYPDGTGRVIGQVSYSSLTRHSHTSHLVTSEQAERTAVQTRRPINDTRGITTEDKWANVARSFANQPEKDSAIALAERVHSLRQGGIKAFQQALLPAQPGHRAGQAMSQGPDIVQRRHIDIDLKAYGQALRQTLNQAKQVVSQQVQRIVHRHEQRGPSMRM